MSTSPYANAIGAQMATLATAMAERDLNALLSHYDEHLVFIDGGTSMDKVGLAEYVRELWSASPDFEVNLAAHAIIGNVLAATLEASAGATTGAGVAVTVTWPIFALYTFDIETMKIVREVAFTDEEALAQTYQEMGLS